MRAPIGRRGGKSKIANSIIKLFPKTDWNIYVEPFVGAGNVFYRMPKAEHEVINDKDKDMIIIHKGLRDHALEIQNSIPRTVSKSMFEKLKNKEDPASVIARYRNSFLAKGKNYQDSRGSNKADYSKYVDRLKNVKILNKDYNTVIKEFDSPKTFFYLDPPYEQTGSQQDYTHYVKPEQVYHSLQGLKGKFLLSYNDSPNIINIFKKYKKRRIHTYYANLSGGAPIEKTELLISNY